MYNDILELFAKSSGKGIKLKDIKTSLSKKYSNVEEELPKILSALESDGTIYSQNNEVYYSFPSDFFITEIKMSKKGNPFIVYNGVKYYSENLSLSGIVGYEKVILKVDDEMSLPHFSLVKILERKITDVICEVKTDTYGNKYVQVCNDQNFTFISLGHNDMKKLVEGDRILVHLTNEFYESNVIGKIKKYIGHKNDLDTELEIIAVNNGFKTEYGPQIEKELETMPTEVTSDDLIGRVDKRGDRIFTIDGPYTKDIDDAVELKKLDNGNFLLTVSIAHVSHYIKPNTAMWNFAQDNTTSLYLVDSVLAMLHHQVSNGICSLNPNVDRLARSFEMEIDQNGEIINFKTYKSVIHSMKKMSYPEVNEILINGNVPEGYEDFVDDLLLMNELSHILTKKRAKAGAIDLQNKELSFHKEDGTIINHVNTQEEAEKIIENFMVITNIAVGTYFNHLLLPFIYRNHESPFIAKIEENYKFLKSLNYPLEKLRSYDDPKIIQKMIATLKDKEEFVVLSGFILKSMQKAYYSNHNKGHFGLAVNYYSQSTSPIRRFLDLVIHTLIDYYEEMTEDFDKFYLLDDYLEKVCAHASFKERCADKAEYEADQLYMVYYMQDKIGEEFIGYISDINSNYISIKTEDLIDGICYYELTNTGAYFFPPNKAILAPDKTKLLKIGDKVELKLSDVNLSERQIYFDILTPELSDTMKRRRTR